MRKINNLNISLIYSSITFVLIFLSYFFDSKIQENSIIFLLLVVTFFGLPHGALDTLVAKKNRVFTNFYGFSLFNLGYLSLASCIFFIWYLVPFLSLVIFLLISAWHFSEDWKNQLDTFQRTILGLNIINLPAFFYPKEVTIIYEMLVERVNIMPLISIQENLMYVLFLLLGVVMARNTTNKLLLFQVTTIFLSSIFLSPLYYFISYFCFFHSIKNFQETVDELKTEKNKIMIFLIINTIITIIFGFFLFCFFLDGSITSKIVSIVFVGLASLTVPHMLLKISINNKKRSSLL